MEQCGPVPCGGREDGTLKTLTVRCGWSAESESGHGKGPAKGAAWDQMMTLPYKL